MSKKAKKPLINQESYIMKKQSQKVVAVSFESEAVELNAIKAAEIELAQMNVLLNTSEIECIHCQLEQAITICLDLAKTRDQILCDENFDIVEETRIALIEERNAFIIHAYESVMKLYSSEEVH
jgi:hypothetical protein